MAEPSSPTPPPGRVYEVLTAGDRLGQYTVVSCISYDILGSLYRVTDGSGEERALFALPKILSEDDSFMRRFKDLREKLARLTHPAILSLGESENIDGRICFVCESFDGRSIPDYLGAAGIYPTFKNPQGVIRAHPSEESKDFTPDKIRKVVRAMIEALGHAHANNTLHLNLTPSNVLLGRDGTAKIVGFGLYGIIGTASIEALVSAGIPAVSLGPRNVRLNTADIISPEVHLKQDPDPRADIYALGMCAYWMLTGLKPSANYRPPSGIVPGLNPGWDIFLARCLTREKTKRYPNAAAALRDLDNLETLKPGGFAEEQARSADEKSAKEAAAKKRKKRILLGAVGLVALTGAGAAYLLSEDDTPPAVAPAAADTVPPGSPVTRAAAQTPTFVFKVIPATASINFPEAKAVFAAARPTGIVAPAGPHRIVVSAPGFVDRDFTLTATPDATSVVEIELGKTAGTAEITSAPGAVVFLTSTSGKRAPVGTVAADGKLTIAGLPVGAYTLEVLKDKCEPAKIPGLTVAADDTVRKTVKLEGALGSLRVTCATPGATISIDGNDRTDLQEKKGIKPGTEVELVFSKPGYRNRTAKVVVNAGDNLTIQGEALDPCRGTIRYDVTYAGRPATPAQLAKLTLARNDDKLQPRNWDEAQKLPAEVPVGHYLLKATHPDCEPFQTAFQVKDGETIAVSVDLRPVPSPLDFSLEPKETPYKLRVGNREYENAAPPTLPGDTPVHIEIEAPDYLPWATDLTPKPRRTTTLAVQLKRIPPPTYGAGFEIPRLGIRLAWIPPGEARLGSPATEPERTSVEGPYTWAAYSKGFWMGVTEITQSEFDRVLGYNPSRRKKSNQPVENISLNDVKRFCVALTKREREAGRLPAGYEYRAPCELEWEYACRAGSRDPFSFGQTATTAQGNFLGFYPNTDGVAFNDDAAVPRPVASYPPNAYGLYDMHGNVREWVIDPYRPHLPGGKRVDYTLRDSELADTECLTRGGSFRLPAAAARSAARPAAPLKPDFVDDDLGFRIVLAPEARR